MPAPAHTSNCRWELYQVLAHFFMWGANFPSILKHAAYLQDKAVYFMLFVAILHFLLSTSLLEWSMNTTAINKDTLLMTWRRKFIFHLHKQTHQKPTASSPYYKIQYVRDAITGMIQLPIEGSK